MKGEITFPVRGRARQWFGEDGDLPEMSRWLRRFAPSIEGVFASGKELHVKFLSRVGGAHFNVQPGEYVYIQGMSVCVIDEAQLGMLMQQ